MRLLAAALLCLFALPAHAQRVDTRVIDISGHADGRSSCRFNAVSDMKMTEGRFGKGAFAEWARKARDGDAWLHARFSQDEPVGRIQMIEVAAMPVLDKAVSAQVFLDAGPSPVAFEFTHAGWDRWVATPRDGAALAEAMRYTDLLTIRLLAKGGKRLGSYEFWIGDLQDIAEYPQIIKWRCR